MIIDEIECPDCNGHGEVCGVNRNRRSRFVGCADLSPDDFTVNCESCDGKGWRAPTEDELADMAESQAEDRASGEPPMSAQEMYEAAYRLKQELRR